MLKELPQHKFYSNINHEIKINLSNASANTPDLSKYIDTEKLSDFILKTPMTYTSIEGSLKLRGLISNLYQNIDNDEILVFSGAQEAIFSTYTSILVSGDEVIVLTPCYQSLIQNPINPKIKFTSFDIKEDDCWSLNLTKLENKITQNTKMISINYPHNPTGAHLNLKEVTALVNLAQKYNLYILSDEVSSFSIYDQKDFWSLASLYDKAISISVMSKSFGLSGIRVGWAITKDRQVLKQLKVTKTYLSICISKTDEYLAEQILAHSNELLFKNNNIIVSNIKLLKEIIPDKNWIPPKAGIVCLIKVNNNIDELCNFLLKRKVLILPAYLFGFKGDYFRLGLGDKKVAKKINEIKEILF